jgi:predicted RNase H-like HicB family nuclease
MDKIKDDLLELTVSLKYKQVNEELFVGQCLEFPFIIVKGKTIMNLFEKIGEHLSIYFTTYPEKAEKIFSKQVENPELVKKEIAVKEEPNNWKIHEQLITIPAR